MNLFRSEEHARSWSNYDSEMEYLLKPLSRWAEVFSNPIFRNRGRSDYVSWILGDEGRAAFGSLRADLAPPA